MIGRVLLFCLLVGTVESVLLRSWREGIAKTHNYAQHLAMHCHLHILNCASLSYDEMHNREVHLASFSIYSNEVPFPYITLQRIHSMNKVEMFTFWQLPTVYNIVSIRNEIISIKYTYDRVESLRDARDTHDSLMDDHMTALRIINSTLSFGQSGRQI